MFNMKICFNCKKEVPENSIYCMYCAYKVSDFKDNEEVMKKIKELPILNSIDNTDGTPNQAANVKVSEEVKQDLTAYKILTNTKYNYEAINQLLQSWAGHLDHEGQEFYDNLRIGAKQ